MENKKLIENLSSEELQEYRRNRQNLNASRSVKEAEGHFFRAKEILAKAKER